MLKNIQLELEELFDIFNKELFGGCLKPCFITIQATKPNIKGWQTDNVWIDTSEVDNYHEININPVYLTGTLEVSETLIHEMVHLYNAQIGMKDCSKTGYHNKSFKNKAEDVGLTGEKSSKKGWCETGLSPKLEMFIFDLKRPEVFIYKRLIVRSGASKSKVKLYKYKCPDCSYEVSSRVKDLKLRCGVCGSLYERIKKDEDEDEDDDEV